MCMGVLRAANFPASRAYVNESCVVRVPFSVCYRLPLTVPLLLAIGCGAHSLRLLGGSPMQLHAFAVAVQEPARILFAVLCFLRTFRTCLYARTVHGELGLHCTPV